MKNKKFILIIIIGIIGVFLILVKRDLVLNSLELSEKNSVDSISNNTSNFFKSENQKDKYNSISEEKNDQKNNFQEDNSKNTNENQADKTANREPINFNSMTNKEFLDWINQESKSMNSVIQNAKVKEFELVAAAQTLTSAQIELLAQEALNFYKGIDSRILSAYLLSLNTQGESSLQAMFNIARSQLPEIGPIKPHTEGEVKRAQELAIRYMEVDQLFEQAKTISYAYDKLILLAKEAETSEVRNYASKKISELKFKK